MKPDSLPPAGTADNARTEQLAQALADNAGVDDVTVFLGLAAATVRFENQLRALAQTPGQEPGSGAAERS